MTFETRAPAESGSLQPHAAPWPQRPGPGAWPVHDREGSSTAWSTRSFMIIEIRTETPRLPWSRRVFSLPGL